MAEAREAMKLPPLQPGWHSLTVDPHLHIFQAAITDHGLLIYIPHPRYLLRSSFRFFYSIRNKLMTALYPIHPLFALILTIITAIYVIFAEQDSWFRSGFLAEWLWAVDEQLIFVKYFPLEYRLAYLSTIASVGILLVIVFFQRLFLRYLLHYKGWVFDPPGKPSLLTKIWLFSLQYGFLKRGKSMTYVFQHALPRQPVPRLKDTTDTFMRTVRPLVNDEEYDELDKARVEFLEGPAGRLQKYLIWRSWMTSNYLSDWWLRFVYLRGRDSIYINSNYYAIPCLYKEMYCRRQITRAALSIYSWIKLKRKIDRETFTPLVSVQPLCMEQYKSIFSTTRIPHREEDTLCHWDPADSKHVVVLYKGVYYKLKVYNKHGDILSPYELQLLLEHIMSDRDSSSPPSKAAAHIAALTTLPRSNWAEIRENHFSVGENHYSLSQIEKSIFVVQLDENEPETLQEIGKFNFLGNGGDRWCDKSMNHIFYKNGYSGLHCEHSWADAPVISHTCEVIIHSEVTLQESVGEDGRIKAPEGRKVDLKGIVMMPAPLRFLINRELEEQILDALGGAEEAKENLDLQIEVTKFGKGTIKKFRLSPDSFVQMGLQLAFYRNQNKTFGLTYESAMMRLFRDGRTETIRSLSIESKEFVLAMEDPSVSREEKRRLHQVAVEGHNSYAKKASVGGGIDRHLFALYVVAMGTETDSPFLNKALKIPWKLSTSQIPHRMYDKWPKYDNRGNNPGTQGVGGGFGPVADDGYGVCYLVRGENSLVFHVSSKKSCPTTDSSKFVADLMAGFDDIMALYD
eukprot:CAMPEP_0201476960 /NCGR_PEP_ID=MMETSP0151_2-20130828/2089_1 /ASSEMBLY_ACC=CAM_ASM_000257 /TAXON_ID=200890 /ORGANISM="Paramoeba atlantica, Strain 621/1 / CCAP 1560/9" /LENGTH=795 /DNA_ID=CAMNT_0047857533 /DNA_START=82 /DNA_END=2469 /DNA_ORIENTATION=+